MKKFLLAASAVALMSSGALGADIYNGGGLKDGETKTSSVTWTGIYLGGHVGYEFGGHNVKVDDTYQGKPYNVLDIDGISRQGAFAGLDGGVDVRLGGRFVIGALGVYDFALGDNEATISAYNGALKGDAEKGDEWGVGGRFGILLDERDLLYVGALWMQTDVTVEGFKGGKSIGSLSEDYDGIRGVAGWEHSLGSGFFTKLEASYTDYETVVWYSKGGEKITDDMDQLQVKFGVTFKPPVKLPGLE